MCAVYQLQHAWKNNCNVCATEVATILADQLTLVGKKQKKKKNHLLHMDCTLPLRIIAMFVESELQLYWPIN
jgi:hypothetical protein